MKISIIIPVLINSPNTKLDEWLWLKKCIHSLKKNSTEDHEIIVVTNNGDFKFCPIDGIKQIHLEEQGQCIAVNLGVKKALNEYVMIIDEDMIFPTNWEELTEKAKEYEFVSGNLMERGEIGAAHPFKVNHCGGILDFNEQKFEADALTLKEDKWENGFGFPLICKKSIWELVEGYDEGYDPWGSNCDSDLEYKLMLAGIMPKRWRGVLVYHFAQVSGTFAAEQGTYWDRNTRFFEQKWGIARARSPEIWYCDFIIDGEKVLYRPKWAKFEGNPNVYSPKFKLQHIGWITQNWDIFERFWCGIMGFKNNWESRLTPEMTKTLFGVEDGALCRRYEKDGVTIEIHQFDHPTEDILSFTRRGLNHICLHIDDREKFLKMYPFDKKIYNNPKGYQNIFIRDLEGNWVELYKTLL